MIAPGFLSVDAFGVEIGAAPDRGELPPHPSGCSGRRITMIAPGLLSVDAFGVEIGAAPDRGEFPPHPSGSSGRRITNRCVG